MRFIQLLELTNYNEVRLDEIFVFLIILFSFADIANSQIQATTTRYKVYEYSEIKNTPEFEAYLSGYIDALYQVKRTNEQLGVQVLYCPPDYSAVSINVAKSILERELFSQDVIDDPKMQFVDIGSMVGYSIFNNYPCND